MTEPQFLDTPQGRKLAYNQTPGEGPGVVFLGGFKSDMEGSKALHLEGWARAAGVGFLRFDYSGHGQSSGRFEDGAIGDWAEDACAAISALTEGPQVLVGSSMGGWLSLLAAQRMPGRIAGLVGIAAAPDFTEAMRAELSPERLEELSRTGRTERPSDYADSPYVITRRLLEDGARHCLLNAPVSLPFPTRFLQGTADTDVPVSVALRLLDRAEGDDVRLTLVKGADHRFSTPECLAMIERAVTEVRAAG